MTTGIGATNCDFVQGGYASSLKQRVMSWTTPGINGVWGLKLGFSQSRFGFRALLFDTEANVQTWVAALEAAQGTIVTITDDWGRAFANCLILDVALVQRTPAIGTSSRGNYTCRAELAVTGVVVQGS